MTGKILPVKVMQLPATEDGWFDVVYSISLDGALQILRADFDIRGTWRDYRQASRLDPSVAAPRLPPPGTNARLVSARPPHLDFSEEFPLEWDFPAFDRLADGNWVIAHRRCGRGGPNASILTPHGATLRRLPVGDGINHLQCDSAGNIWVGYFDEGIFGDPLSSWGLNRFSSTGELTWHHPNDLASAPTIDDCYAMNVSDCDTWVCTYADFPIVQVPSNGNERIWANDALGGASFLAVDKDHVALLGGYQEESETGALLRLHHGVAEVVEKFEVGLPERSIRDIPLAFGRGGTFHFVTDEAWYQLSVKDIARNLGVLL